LHLHLLTAESASLATTVTNTIAIGIAIGVGICINAKSWLRMTHYVVVAADVVVVSMNKAAVIIAVVIVMTVKACICIWIVQVIEFMTQTKPVQFDVHGVSLAKNISVCATKLEVKMTTTTTSASGAGTACNTAEAATRTSIGNPMALAVCMFVTRIVVLTIDFDIVHIINITGVEAAIAVDAGVEVIEVVIIFFHFRVRMHRDDAEPIALSSVAICTVL
jgi:hypothetical protein